MVSRWYRSLSERKKQSLHSLCAGFAFFAVLFLVTEIFGKSLCPIKAIFGIRCFGCGLTRGFISVIKLDFAKACEYNIMSLPLFFAIFLYVVLSVTDLTLKKNLVERLEMQLCKKYMYVVYVLILIMASIINNK